jgi:hypothetical protein
MRETVFARSEGKREVRSWRGPSISTAALARWFVVGYGMETVETAATYLTPRGLLSNFDAAAAMALPL